MQRDALKEAGCGKDFSDNRTGSKFERKGWEELLAFVRSGDTVILRKLDRLGRSPTAFSSHRSDPYTLTRSIRHPLHPLHSPFQCHLTL